MSKSYGAFKAIRDLSLWVEPGEFVTLLGPSGSGKTTTLAVIAGFVAPSDGQILINGSRVEHLPPERRNVGVVFQHYALFPHMTVQENVAFPLEMRAIPRPRVRELVRTALASVQMEAFGDRVPSELSGGQQQRIALARALVFKPPILLLDEPLSALDKKLRETMQLELKQLHLRTDTAMIYVTHDQEEALLLSDRVAVINNGQLEQMDKPEAIYARPRNRFVAAFVGESNFLEAEVAKLADGHMVLRTAGGLECISKIRAPAEVGSRLSAMVRPEQVVLGPQAAELGNHFYGRITEEFFIGRAVKYKVALSPSESILVTVAKPCGEGGLGAVGRQIMAGWEPDDMLTYADRDR
ncbi:MAG: ABC transporter ATP-binding protein [Acetobacteraceae bacterium]